MEYTHFPLLMFLFVVMIFYSIRIKRLEHEVNKLNINQKGERNMSKIIKDIIGKQCRIIQNFDFTAVLFATILDVDENWVKISFINKNKTQGIKIIRIEDIKSVEVIESGDTWKV